MDLFQVVLLPVFAADVAGGLGRRRGDAGQVGEMGLHQVEQPVVVERAGGGDHHAVRAVVVAHVVDQGFPLHAANHVLGPEGRASHRLAGVRMTPRSRSSSSGMKVLWVRMSPMMSAARPRSSFSTLQ